MWYFNERLYHWIWKFKSFNGESKYEILNIHDKVLDFKLLDGATVSENQRQMCLAFAHDLTFNSIKTALKRFFSDKTNPSKEVTNQFKNLNIKQEESVFAVD